MTDQLFYVGIGGEKRPYSLVRRSQFWKNVVKKYGYRVEVKHENLDWQQACDLEIQYIKEYGRQDKGTGVLVNQTDGGDGSTGHIGYWNGKKNPSVGYYNKIYPRRSWVGRKHTDETKKKIGLKSKGRIAHNKGKPGKKWTEEHRAQHIARLTGHKCSEETKRKMSEASKGKKKNYPNWNIRLKGLGIIKTSEETKLKLSKALKLAWEKRKVAATAAC